VCSEFQCSGTSSTSIYTMTTTESRWAVHVLRTLNNVLQWKTLFTSVLLYLITYIPTRQAMYILYNMTLRCTGATTVAIVKQQGLYSVCVFVAFGIQHAMHICKCAIQLPVACPTIQYFSTLYHIYHDLKKKVTEHKMYFDFLYNCCLKHFSF
jgi:hypothetical protein